MATTIFSCLVDGLEAHHIEVEVDILQGLPGLSIVGLGDAAVQEAKERIRSAIKNSGATYPQQKKIINLAPAHLRKNGACFDVPMALGLMAASGQIRVPAHALVVGELALNGEIRPVKGAISIALFAQKNNMELFLPAANTFEAELIDYPKIYTVQHLSELIGHFKGEKKLMPFFDSSHQENHQNQNRRPEPAGSENYSAQNRSVIKPEPAFVEPEVDMNMIQGQIKAKRALQIAAAGGHHLLFYGPPGTGKTLLAQALQGILPPLTRDEMLEVMQIYSSAGLLKNPQKISYQRPFRQIHQTCSLPALIGGGLHAQPGEISLAHHGILFFDEIAEAPRSLLESLRQPLEEKRITVSRLNHHVTYPAKFTFVAAMNPCPCGYYGNQEKSCTCTNNAIVQYHKKLSGPILDRFDIFLCLQREPIKLHPQSNTESSHDFQKNILAARKIQYCRFQKFNNLSEEFIPQNSHPHENQKNHAPKIQIINFNSEMKIAHINQFCTMDAKTEAFITTFAEKEKVSARSFHNILKLARTIADLSAKPQITQEDALEAFSYRIQPTSPLI